VKINKMFYFMFARCVHFDALALHSHDVVEHHPHAVLYVNIDLV
jgi:hypothetical protein